jgi:outer membrane protein W
MGYWDSGRRQNPLVEVYGEDVTRVEDLVGAFSYAYWVDDRIATDITMRGLVAEATSIDGASGTSESAVIVTSAMFGIRLYPISSARTPLRPYIAAGAGPYLGIESRREIDDHIVENVKTLGSFGGYLGGGLDIQMGRHLMAGIHVGYNVMADFPEPLGIEDNFSGVELSVGISVLLGKGIDR